MTPIILLDALKAFIEEKTADMILPVRPRKNSDGKTERAPIVFQMAVPKKEDETNQIPYIVLQVLTGKDEQKDGEEPDSLCNVRIVVATYSEDESEGKLFALNLISRIRLELLKIGVIGEQFYLKKSMEWVIYPDDTAPYYLGEMLTAWEMPTVRQNENPWEIQTKE